MLDMGQFHCDAAYERHANHRTNAQARRNPCAEQLKFKNHTYNLTAGHNKGD